MQGPQIRVDTVGYSSNTALSGVAGGEGEGEEPALQYQ